MRNWSSGSSFQDIWYISSIGDNPGNDSPSHKWSSNPLWLLALTNNHIVRSLVRSLSIPVLVAASKVGCGSHFSCKRATVLVTLIKTGSVMKNKNFLNMKDSVEQGSFEKGDVLILQVYYLLRQQLRIGAVCVCACVSVCPHSHDWTVWPMTLILVWYLTLTLARLGL